MCLTALHYGGLLQEKAVAAGLPNDWGFTALESQSSSTTSSDSGSIHLSGGAIAGIVVGGVAVTSVIGVAAFFAVVHLRHLAGVP